MLDCAASWSVANRSGTLGLSMTRHSLQLRVIRVADAVLARQQFVSAVDVLIDLGWLAPSHVDMWRQGRVESLESLAQVNPTKITTAMAELQRWAQDRGLKPSETDYFARTLDRRQLRFSVAGTPPASARTARTGCRRICLNVRSSGRVDHPSLW